MSENTRGECPVFDREGAFKRVENDVDLFFELIGVLKDQFGEKYDSIKRGIKLMDRQNISQLAHAIKSSFGNLGAVRAYNVAAKIEEGAKDLTADELMELLGDLMREYENFMKEVSDFRSTLDK